MITKQVPFSCLWQGYKSDEDCKFARNTYYKKWSHLGATCKRWALPGQLRQYWAFGKPCNQTCSVYYITVSLNEDRVTQKSQDIILDDIFRLGLRRHPEKGCLP